MFEKGNMIATMLNVIENKILLLLLICIWWRRDVKLLFNIFIGLRFMFYSLYFGLFPYNIKILKRTFTCTHQAWIKGMSHVSPGSPKIFSNDDFNIKYCYPNYCFEINFVRIYFYLNIFFSVVIMNVVKKQQNMTYQYLF